MRTKSGFVRGLKRGEAVFGGGDLSFFGAGGSLFSAGFFGVGGMNFLTGIAGGIYELCCDLFGAVVNGSSGNFTAVYSFGAVLRFDFFDLPRYYFCLEGGAFPEGRYLGERAFGEVFSEIFSENFFGNLFESFSGNFSENFFENTFENFTGNFSRSFFGNYFEKFSGDFSENFFKNYFENFSENLSEMFFGNFLETLSGGFSETLSPNFFGGISRDVSSISFVGEAGGYYPLCDSRAAALGEDYLRLDEGAFRSCSAGVLEWQDGGIFGNRIDESLYGFNAIGLGTSENGEINGGCFAEGAVRGTGMEFGGAEVPENLFYCGSGAGVFSEDYGGEAFAPCDFREPSGGFGREFAEEVRAVVRREISREVNCELVIERLGFELREALESGAEGVHF